MNTNIELQYNTEFHCHWYLSEGDFHHGDIVHACAIHIDGGPQRQYQVSKGQEAHQVYKNVQKMSLAAIRNPVDSLKERHTAALTIKHSAEPIIFMYPGQHS